MQQRTSKPDTRALDEAAWKPLFPEPNVDQGDPFLFEPPSAKHSRHRYYVYSTGQGPIQDGRAFSVYASNDLVTWTRLSRHALKADLTRAHWAPSVTYVPGLLRPYVMLYSRAKGVGDEAHINHQIMRADATEPEGPFEPSGHVLTDGTDFAIDPDVFTFADGRRVLAFASDFVGEAPLGTGLMIAEISSDLTTLKTKPERLMRASADWQVYDHARSMPWKEIPTVDWERGDRVRWYCLEGPCGGLISPKGRDVILYSGGCYFGFYAVGALVRDPETGLFTDAGNTGAKFVAGDYRPFGINAPGHCSIGRAPDGSQVLMIHARFPEGNRQMTITRIDWDENDLPVCRPPA